MRTKGRKKGKSLELSIIFSIVSLISHKDNVANSQVHQLAPGTECPNRRRCSRNPHQAGVRFRWIVDIARMQGFFTMDIYAYTRRRDCRRARQTVSDLMTHICRPHHVRGDLSRRDASCGLFSMRIPRRACKRVDHPETREKVRKRSDAGV